MSGTSMMQELLTEALATEWTPEQAAVLEQTEGVESVVDAVQRVAAHLPQACHNHMRMLRYAGFLPCNKTAIFSTTSPTLCLSKEKIVVLDEDFAWYLHDEFIFASLADARDLPCPSRRRVTMTARKRHRRSQS
jgi:hypothetical protein